MNDLEPEVVYRFYSLSAAADEETLQFWTKHLHSYCLQNGHLCLKSNEIVEKFTSHNVVPEYFPRSLNELVKRNICLPCDALKYTKVETDLSIVEQMFQTILTIGTNAITSIFSSTETQISEKVDEGFCVVSVLEEIEAVLLSYAALFSHSRELTFTIDEIPKFQYNLSAAIHKAAEHELSKASTSYKADIANLLLKLSSNDIQIVIAFMKRRKTIIQNDNVIQIVNPSKNNIDSIDDNDTAYLQLQTTIFQISQKIANLQTKSANHTNKAIAAKSSGNTNAAMMQLKLRKNCQGAIDKLLQAEYSLEECLQTIEAAETNAMVINAYKTAAQSLSQSRKQNNLSVESVESAIDLFQEEMEEMQEISEAMTTSVSTIAVDEQSELEAELDELLKKEEPPKQEPTISLPTAPAHSVTVATELRHVEGTDDDRMPSQL